MAQLLVRDLEDDVAAGVRRLAVVNKRSAEEARRAILLAHVRDHLTGPKRRSLRKRFRRCRILQAIRTTCPRFDRCTCSIPTSFRKALYLLRIEERTNFYG